MESSIILFDGVCNLCSRFVNFVIERDPKARFKFAALQSPEAALRLEPYKGSFAEGPPGTSIVLMEGGRIFKQSTAILRIFCGLQQPWPMMYVFILVPPFLRNFVYSFIAKRRYGWYGKSDACRMPTEKDRARFL